MSSMIDEYLGRVRRGLVGVDRAMKEDVVRELATNLADAVRANHGNAAAAVSALGPADEVARRFKQIYGYGKGYNVAFVGAAVVLGLLSLPVLAPNPEFSTTLHLPTAMLVVLIGFLLWVSVEAGAFVGLAAGIGAAAARLSTFAAIQLSGQTFTASGLTLLIVVSGLLVGLGWLPGRTKRAWKKPEADL